MLPLITATSRLLGSLPIDRHGRLSRLSMILSTIALLALVTVDTAMEFKGVLGNQPKIIVRVLGFCLRTLQKFNLLVHIINLWCNRKSLKIILRTYVSSKLNMVERLLYVWCLCYVCTMYLGICSLQSFLPKLREGVVISMDYMNILVVFQYCHFIMYSRELYLSGLIRNVNLKVEMNMRLVNVIKIVTDMYGKSLLVTYFYFFCTMVSHIYVLIVRFKFAPWSDKLYCLNVVVTRILFFFLPCIVAERYGEKVDKHYKHIFEEMWRSPLQQQRKDLVLYTTLRQRAKFRICGSFTLGYPLITSIMVGTVTYLVILSQEEEAPQLLYTSRLWKKLRVFFQLLLFMHVASVKKHHNMSASPVILSATAKHTATIIFLHGLGDTGHGWASAIGAIRPPFAKVICPTAPTMPVTLNSGFKMPSWFDLKSLDASANEDEDGIKKAAESVHKMIQAEEAAGIRPERILIGGFSQGGALALYSAFTYSKKLGGVMALSCWLPLHKQFPGYAAGNKDTPILQCHGDCDPLVPYKWGQMTASILKQFASNVEFKTYRGLGHSSAEEEMVDLKEFAVQCLSAE